MVAPSPQDGGPNLQGCMIGLFWIEQDKVCLGSPPVEEDPGVFLSTSRLSVGEGALQQTWPWTDVTDLQVLDVPVRSAAARWAARVTSVVAAALNAWGPGGPSMMTAVVCVEATTSVSRRRSSPARPPRTHSGRSTSRSDFSPTSYGAAPRRALLTQWWQENQPSDVLHSQEREAVLEGWMAPLR